MSPSRPIEILPATPARWPDVEKLFGPNGACSGCWCMWARFPSAEYRQGYGEPNRRALRAVVKAGREPGLIAYQSGEPIGWCALAPRPVYRRLESSRILKPVDDQPVWSVVCFFIARDARNQGLTVKLLRAAVRYAAVHGARIVEGYPVEVKGRTAAAFAWTGFASAFRAAGFREVDRRSPTRPIMRKVVKTGAKLRIAALAKSAAGSAAPARARKPAARAKTVRKAATRPRKATARASKTAARKRTSRRSA